MNARQRFLATFRFEEVDRPFYWETPGVWPATVKRWKKEGMPQDLRGRDISSYFKMDKLKWIPVRGGWTGNPYCPAFEEVLIDDDGVNVTKRGRDGIVKKEKKVDPDTSMPQFLEFPVKSRDDFDKKIKHRLDCSAEGRFPNNWDELVKEYETRDYPLGLHIIGPFGFVRNLFGDEDLMYTLFDDPQLIHDIMIQWKDFYIGFLSLLSKDVIPDFVMIWEDICYNNGPLISPESFKEFMSPYLIEVINKIKDVGITGIVVDTDGDCSKMLPIYLDCGANAFYPFEVQAGMDIVQLKKQYKDKFVIIGGLDKMTLAIGKEEVVKEVDSKVPFMLKHKGYIPMLDHTVPPNVPYNMFKFFVEYIRKF